MKQQKYTLTIDKPCEQKWASMTKSDAGRFCSHCSKTVIDFTQLTDAEIIQIIEQNSGKLCGRLAKQQLNRLLEVKQTTNNFPIYKILAGLLVFGATENALATDQLPTQTEIVSTIDPTEPSAAQKDPTTDSLNNIVQGIVLDKNKKEPLAFANISLKDTKLGTITDLDGKFKLLIPDNLLKDEMTLVITFVGYEITEITIYKKDLPIIKELLVTPIETAILGEVCIVKKKKWWQRKK